MTRVINVAAIDIDAIVPVVIVDVAEAGVQGPPGPQGEPGPMGGAAMDYAVDANTAPPPSTGQLRFNAPDQSAATTIYLDSMTAPGNDATMVLSSIAPGQSIYIQEKDDAACFQTYTVTTGGIGRSGTHFAIPVQWTAGGDPVPVGERAFVQVRSADGSGQGPPGPQGEPGENGISFLSGVGPPTQDQPVGTSYLDATTGDLWQFG